MVMVLKLYGEYGGGSVDSNNIIQWVERENIISDKRKKEPKSELSDFGFVLSTARDYMPIERGSTASYKPQDPDKQIYCIKIIDALLDAGVDFNCKEPSWGNTALMMLMFNEEQEVVLQLTRGLKGKVEFANVTDKEGKTPLQVASFLGYTEVVEALLDAGADVNSKDDNGRTPLMYAAAGGRTEIVELLLAAKAKASIKDKSGKTAQDYAKLSRPSILELYSSCGIEATRGKDVRYNHRVISDSDMSLVDYVMQEQPKILKVLNLEQQKIYEIAREWSSENNVVSTARHSKVDILAQMVIDRDTSPEIFKHALDAYGASLLVEKTRCVGAPYTGLTLESISGFSKQIDRSKGEQKGDHRR